MFLRKKTTYNQDNANFSVAVLDPCVASSSPPNRVRDFTSDPANDSTFGTLDIRKTVTNNTGGNVTRIRWRIIDLTTFPAPSGIADLRPRTSTAVVVTVDRAPCGSGTSNITVQGTTLEQPPAQLNGGEFNSSLASGTVTLATPLANGATLDMRFLLGIQQTGSFKFFVNIEALGGPGFPPSTDPTVTTAKKQQWTTWTPSTTTGITEETPSTPLVSGASPGWFVVVPAASPDRRATTTRKTRSSSEREAEENTNKLASQELRNVPATLDLSTPLTNVTTLEPVSRLRHPCPSQAPRHRSLHRRW